MPRIKQLDKQTTNMIAAGEVVERPVGVVKELVENSIDAGATRISISLVDGGLTKLTVSDNGCGMDQSDAEMCFERHATSKIRNENDLWSIHTLGFRGEALPSIASVSKVTLTTSDGKDNTRVIISYGKVESVSTYPCVEGTEISVEGLFYHTPARLKHMRSNSYETSLIQDVINRFALSHPEISFQLIVDGRESLRTTGQGELLEVIYTVFGNNVAKCAKKVYFSDFDYEVNGYLILPEISRASRNQMIIFLNGRMVRTYRLYQAVREGYGDTIAQGRYPLCVLSITMDPHLLDVNVHPSKWEVRLSKERQLENLLQESVKKEIQGNRPIPQIDLEKVRVDYYQPLAMEIDNNVVKEQEIKYEEPKINKEIKSVQIEKEEIQNNEIEEEEILPLPELNILGQFHKIYIVAQCEQGLVLINIRNAMNRIHYEEILNQTNENPVMVDMLVPITLEVETNIFTRIDEINKIANNLHFEFEPFGNNTLIVRSIPSWIQNLEEEQFLKDLLDKFNEEKNTSFENINKETIAALASKNIRGVANNLSVPEMETIIKDLQKCQNPWTTSSGKTIIVILEEKEIAKEFQK